MDLVTRERMREMDRRTIEGGHVAGILLMERAGRGILRSLLRRVKDLHRRRLVIVCGKGNNGGDGYVVARLLRDRGLWPEVIAVSPVEELEGDARVNAERARACGLRLRPPGDREQSLLASLGEGDLILDALLGTGLSGAARDPALAWIRAMNASEARVVAVDIPSGLSADSGVCPGEAVFAEWTVTMAWPKLGFLFPPAREHVGEIDCVDIGIPESVGAEVGAEAHLVEPADLAGVLPDPGPGSHKGDWGKVLIVGGSPGLTGALALAARASLRAGAGLVRVGLPQSLNPILEEKVTEAMTIPLPEGESGQLLRAAADPILSGYGDWSSLVLGPGLGRFPETERLVLALLGGWRGPLLIDADGLNALAAWGPDSWVPRAREVRAAGRPGGLVLTPHPGEMSRLTGRPVPQIRSNPVGEAREWAARWGVTLVLKGAPSVVASSAGEVFVNSTGNSGLATGGSGDVLSGVIGALLGQGLEGRDAAVLGCFLHGLAADLAVAPRETCAGCGCDGSDDDPTGPAHRARRSLLPGEVVEWLPWALGSLEELREPPFWKWRWV